jgi:hypothetical protein
MRIARSIRWRIGAGEDACCTNAPATSLNRLTEVYLLLVMAANRVV